MSERDDLVEIIRHARTDPDKPDYYQPDCYTADLVIAAGWVPAERPSMPPHLCRTCMRPITYETRTETGYKPRTGWYDDCRIDALVCFKAVQYRHEPLTARERAYYEAGWRAALAPSDPATDTGGEGRG